MDVYSTVLDIVEKMRKDDENKPGYIGEKATNLKGIINRKVIII